MAKKIFLKIKLWFIPCRENGDRPKFLDSDFLLYLVAALIIFKIISAPFIIYISKNYLFADITRNTLIVLANEERKSLGLEPLVEDITLDEAAYLKARDMIEKDYFSHQSPEGDPFWYWIKREGYDYKIAGENLAVGFLDSGEVHQAWLDSFSHKENLLNPDYKETGIGIAKGDFQGNEIIVVVQFFGTPKEKFISQEMNSFIKKEEEKKELPEQEPILSGETFSDAGLVYPAETSQPEENDPASNFLKLFYFDYNGLFQILTYLLLILVIISLMINVSFRAGAEQNDLIFRAFILIVFLSVSAFFSKENIIQLFSHNLIIY